MLRGAYTGVAAMLLQETQVDVVSNNLANANTTGFRKRVAAVKTFPEVELSRMDGRQAGVSGGSRAVSIGSSSVSLVLSGTLSDPSPGEICRTGNPLDCAIEGEGFFRLSDESGNTFFTRAGNFTLDGEGRLVAPSGLLVNGAGGPIEIGEATSVSIREDGSVIADGDEVGRIALVHFESPSLMRQIGSNLMLQTPDSGLPEAVIGEDVNLVSEALERSNVNIVEEMTRMIEASRAYESVVRSYRSEDETEEKMIRAFGV